MHRKPASPQASVRHVAVLFAVVVAAIATGIAIAGVVAIIWFLGGVLLGVLAERGHL